MRPSLAEHCASKGPSQLQLGKEYAARARVGATPHEQPALGLTRARHAESVDQPQSGPYSPSVGSGAYATAG